MQQRRTRHDSHAAAITPGRRSYTFELSFAGADSARTGAWSHIALSATDGGLPQGLATAGTYSPQPLESIDASAVSGDPSNDYTFRLDTGGNTVQNHALGKTIEAPTGPGYSPSIP